MKLVNRTLAFIRALTAAWYFLWALLLFALTAWLVGPVFQFWWPADIFALFLAAVGLQWVRRGCEELTLNETRRSP